MSLRIAPDGPGRRALGERPRRPAGEPAGLPLRPPLDADRVTGMYRRSFRSGVVALHLAIAVTLAAAIGFAAAGMIFDRPPVVIAGGSP